uniref:Uncharacterized protein n=1 Tax=Opuntia streptacantha TaxID=393608 RepID=A0A7C9EZ90_OPUST
MDLIYPYIAFPCYQCSLKCCAKMGLVPSFLGKGLPMKRIMDSAMEQLFHKLVHKEIVNFEEFHMEILDMFSTLNAALPGKHYDMPSHKEVEPWQQRKRERACPN